MTASRPSLWSLSLAVALVLAGSVPAYADVEPNNGVWQAEGPLVNSVVRGSVPVRDDGDNDVDTYLFYIQGPTRLSLARTVGSHECRLFLTNADGRPLLSDTDASLFTDGYAVPGGTHRFFVRVENQGFCGSSYEFRIQPAGALVSGPPMPAGEPTAEPNESSRRPWGPLSPSTWYAGSIETSNDEDWFLLYTRPGVHQLDVSVLGKRSASCYFSDASVELRSSRNHLSSARLGDAISHMRHTVRGARRLLVRIYGVEGGGCGYLVSAGPPGAVTVTPPRNECATARMGVIRHKRAISRSLRALRRATAGGATRKALRQLRRAQRKHKRAVLHRRRVC
jgi:hypothetical protein